MSRYLIQSSYTTNAIAAFVSHPQDRAAGLQALASKLGCRVESFDYALGDYDVVCVMECPDDASAAAIALAVNAPGHIKSYRTTKLISQEDFLAAQKKAHGVSYQGPTRA